MSKTSNWKANEDKALMEIYRDRKITKWARISVILLTQFGFKKSPKKCRERYKNHLNPTINKDEWSPQEEELLLELQAEIGNRWAELARRLPGRTDNSVKNKFYSIFRHAISKINSNVQKNKNGDFRELQMSFIYKLITLIDSKFKPGQQVSEELMNEAENLKTQIVNFYKNQPKDQDLITEELTELKKKIQIINQQFKKKILRKRRRRISVKKDGQSTDLRLPTEHQEFTPEKAKKEAIPSMEKIPARMGESPLLILPPSVEKLCMKGGSQQGEHHWVQCWNHDDSDLWRQQRCFSSPEASH